MRLNRRHLLAGLASLTWARPALAIEQTRFPLEIAGRPIRSFEPRSPDRRRFGALQFRGGLVISCHHPRFGGFSALWRSADGRDLVSLTDRGYWLTAKVASQDGRPAGLEEAEMAAMLDAAGRPLARSKSFDTESLAIAGGHAYVGVERTHEILRFDWARNGVEARARSLPVPAALKKLPRNRGLEALGIVPTGPHKGAIVAISERSGREDEPTLGALLGHGAGHGAPAVFQVARPGGYDITDLTFLPGGDMLLLERWYRPLRGAGMRIRRVPLAELKGGALLDGPVLVEADLGYEIDNMEGLSVHQENGRTILTLISDDNFSVIQRTLLLEFELVA